MSFPVKRIVTAKHVIACCFLAAPVAMTCVAGCGSSPTTLALDNPTVLAQRSSGSVTEVVSPDSSELPLEESSELVGPSFEEKVTPAEPVPSMAPKLVGRWQDSFFGKRTLILNADGTAKMILDLDFAGRLLYGSHLEFDMTWTVEEATVAITMLEGQPAKSAEAAMKTWGTYFEYVLDAVGEDQVNMHDADMAYILKRVVDLKALPMN